MLSAAAQIRRAEDSGPEQRQHRRLGHGTLDVTASGVHACLDADARQTLRSRRADALIPDEEVRQGHRRWEGGELEGQRGDT